MLHFIALQCLRAHKNVAHLQHSYLTLYLYRDRSCVVELLQQLKNKQQIMQNNVYTHRYSVYIGSLCNSPLYGTLYLQCGFKGIRKNLNAVRHSIELFLL